MMFPPLLAAAQRAALCLRSRTAAPTARRGVNKREFAFAAVALWTLIGVAAADEVLTTDGRIEAGDVRFNGTDLQLGHDHPLQNKDWAAVRFTAPVYRPLSSGIVLCDGTALAGQVTALDEHGVTIQPIEGDSVVIPLDSIARIQFTAIDEARLKPIPDGQVTGLLKDGDSFTGTVQSVDGKNLTMDSPVFGPTQFVTGSKLEAIFYHPAKRLEADEVITLADGSHVAVDKLEPVDAGHLRITGRGVGVLRVSVDRIVAIDRHVPGMVDAAELRPTAIDGGPADAVFAVDRAPRGLSTRIIGAPANRVICVTNGSVTFAVPGNCDFFCARAAVPADLVPSSGVKMTVLVDDQPAASVTRYSVDDPSLLSVEVAGHRTVRLKVEPAVPGIPAAVGFWIDPVFLPHVERPKPPPAPPASTQRATTGPAATEPAAPVNEPTP